MLSIAFKANSKQKLNHSVGVLWLSQKNSVCESFPKTETEISKKLSHTQHKTVYFHTNQKKNIPLEKYWQEGGGVFGIYLFIPTQTLTPPPFPKQEHLPQEKHSVWTSVSRRGQGVGV